MSRYTDIAGAIATILAAIPNIGVVHARQRYANTLSGYLDLTEAQVAGVDQIRFWMVRRESVAARPDDEAYGMVDNTHRMVISGAQGLSEAANTHDTFQGLIDEIMAALDSRKDLGLSYVVDYGVGPCSARTIGEEAVGGVLCHVVEIEVPVVTRRTVTYS
jgi:hypothetical protein